MGFSKWAKQAQVLASQHSDKVNAGIDKAAATAKKSQPNRASHIDKAANLARKTVTKS